MYCPKCQTVNNPDSKFCTNCGAKLDPKVEESNIPPLGASEQVDQDQANLVETNEQHTQQPANQVEENEQFEQEPSNQIEEKPQPTEPNEFVEKTKEISKNYWSYVLNALKSPFEASKQVTNNRTDLINSLITVIIFSLLTPLMIYFSSLKVPRFLYEPSFFDTVIIPFFIYLIVLAALVGIIFACVQLMKVEIDISLIFTRFATLLNIPACLVLLSIILLAFNAYFISTILFSIGLIMISLVNIGTMISIKETHYKKGGLDFIYVIIINNAAILLIILLLGDAFIGELFNSFFW